MKIDRAPGSEHRSDDTVFRCDDPDLTVEPITVGFRIDPDQHPVAAVPDVRLEADQGAAAADLRFPLEAPDLGAAGDPLADPKLTDVEPADVDIVIGKNGARFFGRDQFGQTVKGDEIRFQLVDPKPAEQEVDRPPVHLQLRRFREQAVGIVKPDVTKLRPAPDRAVDPADPDPETGGRRHRRDPVDDEPVAGAGVEEGDQSRERQNHEQGDDHCELGGRRQEGLERVAPGKLRLGQSFRLGPDRIEDGLAQLKAPSI